MKTKQRCKEGDFSCILFLFKTTLAAANIIAEIMNGEKALDSKEESALKSINTNLLNYAIINPLGGF